jgi:uncharacterized damage-inducible protein DinB
MPAIEMVRTFIEYDQDMTRRVWASIERITDEQFTADDDYSRGSIRNLMVHLAHTNTRWLNGLKNLPDIQDQLAPYESYTDRRSVRTYWDSVSKDLTEYVQGLTEEELQSNPVDIPGPRWEVLLHLVNHGTDHRATILHRLQEFGAATFDQDFILWIAARYGS